VQQNQSVSEMAAEVLARQASARAKRSGESLEAALIAVLQTEAGRRLGQLRDGIHREQRAEQWQPSLQRERAEERRLARLREERSRLREEERGRARKPAWESFMRRERRELELRKDGQLADLLGEALAGETPAALGRLAREDQRQAEEGLVALTSNGKMYYSSWRISKKGTWLQGSQLQGCGKHGSRSGRTGGSITGEEAPKGKAACSNLRWRVLRTYSMCRVSSCLAISLSS
jgi:hypothetical protein